MSTPLCPYFGKCGGCSSQHIDYAIQLENKRKLVSHHTNHDDVKVFSGKEYYYRNRMDMIFHPRGLGFREKDKWYSVIDIEQCAIANEKINHLIKEIRNYFKSVDFYDLKKQIGTFKQVVIRAPENTTSVSFVLNETSTRLAEAIEKIKEYAKTSTAENIVVTYIQAKSEVSTSENYFVVKGSDTLSEVFLKKRFIYNVQGFFQNNSIMAEKMLEYVNNIMKTYDTKESYLLDLYGGVGTFGITNSDLFKEVDIVENFKGSIDAANINIKENKINNIKTHVLDAMQISRLNLKSPLYVITDPPRSGMDQRAIDKLKSLHPDVIIYISCNPIQLGKELPKFKDYKIKSAAMFDLFPQTPHVEAVVELIRTH
jgi:23S rRNA (uracil1939-C5)-methyltransferase